MSEETDPSDDTQTRAGSAIDLLTSPEVPDQSRRSFLVAGAASWASISLAGCTGLIGEENEDGENEVPHFVVTDEVVAGSSGIPEGAEGFVTPGRPTSAFVPGMEAIFKVGVWDPETGDIVSDVALDEAFVDTDRGEEIDLVFARSDREWTGDWSIPEDESTGTVGYTVTVSNAAEFTNVGIADSEFEIVEFDPVAANYVVTTDTYSTDEYGGGWVQSCLPQYNFTPEMAVGFDVGIYDGSSGEPVGSEVVDEAVVEFEEGDPDSLELEWDEEDELWNNVWRGIPDGYVGSLAYEVTVTNDAEFHNVGVYQGTIEIIEEPEVSDDPTAHYVVTDDTYATEDQADGFVQSCLPQHNFTPEMAVGFDIGIYDGRTGNPVGDDVVDEALLEFETGDPATMELEWDADDELWNNVWRGIPDDYTGTLMYEVQVSNEGEYHRVGVYRDSIFVIEPP